MEIKRKYELIYKKGLEKKLGTHSLSKQNVPGFKKFSMDFLEEFNL